MDSNNGMLTTVDNPYDPFTHYDEWLKYDHEKGYDTNSLLARFTDVKLDMTENEESEEILNAMKRIVNLFPFYMILFEGQFKKYKPISLEENV